MVYYVYLDPAVIQAAAHGGREGLSCLASVLMALTANCCVAEFETGEVRQQLGDEVRSKIPLGTDASKQITMLLAHLEKQNRFIYCLQSPDGHAAISELEAARQQGAAVMLDAIICGTPRADGTVVEFDPPSFCASQLNFERDQRARTGVTLAGGERSSSEFCTLYLRKVLYHAGTIEFIDRLVGPKYGSHYRFTLKALLREYAACCCGAPITVCVHTDAGKAEVIAFCRNEIEKLALGSATVELKVYPLAGENSALPHNRFLLTDQFAIDIGRGLDLFDEHSNRNRDVSLSFKNPKDVRALLSAASASN